MVWKDKKQIIFVHIPKTGGTSIEVAINSLHHKYGYGVIFTNQKNIFDKIRNENLKKVCKMRNFSNNKKYALQHFKSNEYKILLGNSIFRKYLKFSICRNPYDRIISEYFWCQIPGIGDKHGQSFDEFLTYVKKCRFGNNYYETIYHDHFIPQHEFIYDDKDNLQVDKLFKFEKFNEIEFFLKENLEIKNIPHWHKRSKSKTIELSSKQKAKIYKMYKKDFELLNYEK